MDELTVTAPAETTEPRGFDRARDLPRLSQVAQDLQAVEAALRRLDDDTYGTCRVCGEPIDDTDLEVTPTADTCPAHTAAVDA